MLDVGCEGAGASKRRHFGERLLTRHALLARQLRNTTAVSTNNSTTTCEEQTADRFQAVRVYFGSALGVGGHVAAVEAHEAGLVAERAVHSLAKTTHNTNGVKLSGCQPSEYPVSVDGGLEVVAQLAAGAHADAQVRPVAQQPALAHQLRHARVALCSAHFLA